MAIHFISGSKLVEDLAHDRLSERDKANYLLAGIVFGIFAGYSTLVASNPSLTWRGLYELLMVLVIAIYGFERCYSTSKHASSPSFISDFICLSLPITITTMVAVWGIYWGGWYLYMSAILSMSFESQQAIRMIDWINKDMPWLSIFLAVVCSNAIFFLRMRLHLKRMYARKEGLKMGGLK
jgi:hypothetical protein